MNFNLLYKLNKDSFLRCRICICLIFEILLIYPLYLMKGSESNADTKTFLFSILILTASVTYFYSVLKGDILCNKHSGFIDYFFRFYFLCDLIIIFIHSVKGDKILGNEILVLSVIIAYFLISNDMEYKRQYIKLILYSASAVFTGLWIHYLITPNFAAPIGLLISSPQSMAAYMVLIFTISSICYCTENKKQEQWFYLLLNGLSAFFLFVVHDVIGMLLASLIVLFMPLLYRTTAGLIKRVMQLLFLYFFLLSNMALLVNYSGLIKAELSYNLLNSVYLDLGIAVTGMVFFYFWEKIPEGADLENLYLPKVRKCIKVILMLIGSVSFVLLFAGNKLEALKNNALGTMLNQLVKEFQQYYINHTGTFYDAANAYGLVGFLAAVALALLILKEVYRNCFKENKELFLILYVFVAQSLFYSQQSVTTPIYIVLLAMAIHGGQNCREPERGLKDAEN